MQVRHIVAENKYEISKCIILFQYTFISSCLMLASDREPVKGDRWPPMEVVVVDPRPPVKRVVVSAAFPAHPKTADDNS